MNTELRETLRVYRNVTVNIIETLEREDFDLLESLLSQRQVQIDIMNNLIYTKEEFTNVCNEFQILMLQQKLTLIMNRKKSEVRREIDKISESKTANKSYNKGFSVDSIYFNKKI